MAQIEGKPELPIAAIVGPQIIMADDQHTWAEGFGEADASPKNLHEVMVALEQQVLTFCTDIQGHSDAIADVFFKPGWTRKPFRALDDLRKACLPPILPDPELATARDVFGYSHDGGC